MLAIIIIMILIGIMDVLLIIGAGKLKTEEEIKNDITEEAKALKELEEQKKLKKLDRKKFLKKLIFWRKNG